MHDPEPLSLGTAAPRRGRQRLHAPRHAARPALQAPAAAAAASGTRRARHHVLRLRRAAVWLLVVAWLVLLTPALAHAHDGGTWDALSTTPEASLPLAVAALVYALGVRRAWRIVGRGRAIAPWQVASFAAGWLSLAAALLSPLDRAAASSFAAHMLQHELMMLLAAPLLCLGKPLVAWWWLRPGRRRATLAPTPVARRAWRVLIHPAGAWTLHAVVLWSWHLPAAFQAASAQRAVHWLQHASFLAVALLFWWSVLKPASRAHYGAALASLFTTMLHTGALGALLTLAPRPWYPRLAEAAQAAGRDPLADQQLGGVLMWAPGGVAFLLAGLWLATRWAGLAATTPVRFSALPPAHRAPRGSAPVP